MNTITLSRDERTTILAAIWRLAPGLDFGDPVPFGSREEAKDSIGWLQLALAVREELGWHDDDARKTFVFTPHALIIDALRSQTASWAWEVENAVGVHRVTAAQEAARKCEALIARLEDALAVTA